MNCQNESLKFDEIAISQKSAFTVIAAESRNPAGPPGEKSPD